MTDPQHALHISAYRFVGLDDTLALRHQIAGQATALALKGTVLIAEEGINLFLAGLPARVGEFLAWLQFDARFAGLTPIETRSAAPPFAKLQVKVKREIIRMDEPTVRPDAGRASAVDAITLARWLDAGRDDAGRPVVLRDTRHAFEVDLGRFRGALDWRIARFGDFPAAAQAHLPELQDKTVVSYCTGGIRCEKAAIYLQRAGAANVLQLEGGILRYFETVGSRHFEGDCFVFDHRRTLGAALAAGPDAAG